MSKEKNEEEEKKRDNKEGRIRNKTEKNRKKKG